MMDKQVGNVWYVPGGRSTMGQMIRDAHGVYPWADDEHSGSLSLPFETVLEKANDAMVWLYRYDSEQPMTREQLLAENEGYAQFRAFRSGELYGCNVRTSLLLHDSMRSRLSTQTVCSVISSRSRIRISCCLVRAATIRSCRNKIWWFAGLFVILQPNLINTY